MTVGLVSTGVRQPSALFEVGSSAEPPVDTPRIPAREAAEHELSKPRYAEQEPSLFRQVIDWIWERTSDLMGSLVAVTPGGWAGLTIICTALLLLLIAVRLRLGALPARVSQREALFQHRPRSAAEHRAAAERYAADQRWTEALQERMRGIVRALEERALLTPRPGRTADEAAEEAGRALPEQATALRAAARAFDEVTYADRQADESGYTRIRDLDLALRESRPMAVAPDGKWGGS